MMVLPVSIYECSHPSIYLSIYVSIPVFQCFGAYCTSAAVDSRLSLVEEGQRVRPSASSLRRLPLFGQVEL